MKIIPLILLVLLFVSCGRGFLDAKPDKALVIPQTLDDLQALLDDVNQQINQTPGLPEIASDDYVAPDGALSALNEHVRKTYLWEKFQPLNNSDWHTMYNQILRVNVVLETLQKMERTSTNAIKYDEIHGAALFFRSWHFFHLLQVFSPPYDSSTSQQDAGIVLKLKADINEKIVRATVESSYSQIMEDLLHAVGKLPERVTVASRPNLAAGYALLSRVYLSRFDYDNSERYADLSLQQNDKLLDYNQYRSTGIFPDPLIEGNDEVLFYAIPILYTTAIFRNARMDDVFIDLYEEGDLRKLLYFNEKVEGTLFMKSTYYTGQLVPFTGLTSAEMYLVKAECLARRGEAATSLQMLDNVRKTRWNSDVAYVEYGADDAAEALELVMQERRRELVFRGLRWFDLRRFNKNPQFAKSRKRMYEGKIYELLPNAPFFSFPLPATEGM
jgi:hypothetical protein